MTKIRIEILF